jgi:hypothetical protein
VGVRITLVFLIARSEGYFWSKIDQKTRPGNQNQVQGPTDSFLAQRNRRFLFECARWSIMQDSTAPASARVSAAKTVLDTAVKAVELEDLEQRLAALEAQSTPA